MKRCDRRLSALELSQEYLRLASVSDQLFNLLHDLVPAGEQGADGAALDVVADVAPERLLIERLEALDEWPVDPHDDPADFEGLRQDVGKAARTINLDDVPGGVEQQIPP